MKFKKERDFFSWNNSEVFFIISLYYVLTKRSYSISFPQVGKLPQDVYFIIFLKVAELTRNVPFFYRHVAEFTLMSIPFFYSYFMQRNLPRMSIPFLPLRQRNLTNCSKEMATGLCRTVHYNKLDIRCFCGLKMCT